MIPPRGDLEAAKCKLHDLNARVLKDPEHKLLHIREFYAEQSPADTHLADIALIVQSIVTAGIDIMPSNQTTHLKIAAPIFISGMLLVGFLSLAAILIGAYAIYKNLSSSTEIHLWGTSLSTSSVGATLIFIGVVGSGWTIRNAFKYAAYSHPPSATTQHQLVPPTAVDIAANNEDNGDGA